MPARYLSDSRPWASGENAADPLLLEHRREAALDPAVEHRVARLVDEAGRSEPPQDGRGLRGPVRRVVRYARVEGLALPHRLVERHHRLFERRLGVEAVGVEDVHVLEAHPLQALVEAREQVLPGAPLAVGPGPHEVAGLRGDDELVAVRAEIEVQEAAHRLLGGAGGRAVVVGEIEVGHAPVEGATHDGAPVLERVHAAEVVPEAERDRG
jgi:hypothetical protein